jgi:excisionase family DNA binding protein
MSESERQSATLTIAQAHVIIGVENITRQALYLAAQRGELPSIRLGRRILIPRHAFEEWLKGKPRPLDADQRPR